MTIASLIVDIGANVAGLEKTVEKVHGSLDGIGSMAKKAGAAIAAAFTVTAVIGAIKSFTDLTGELTDMSAKTGVGTTALQKLKYMAEQSGGSLDQVTAAITKMGVNLVNGDKGAVGAMDRLGLSIDQVRRMEPDQAFAVIADKIAGIESPMERAKIATELFGKAGADMLPMMTGNLEEMGKQAEDMGLILSEDVVAAGDDFGDTLGQLMTLGMALMGKILGPFLPLLTLLAQALVQVATIIGNILGPAIEIVIKVGKDMIAVIVQVVGDLLNFASKIPGVSSVVSGLKAGFDALKSGAANLHQSIVGVDTGAKSAAVGLGKLKSELPPTTVAQKAATEAAKKHKEILEALAKPIKVAELASRDLRTAWNNEAQAGLEAGERSIRLSLLMEESVQSHHVAAEAAERNRIKLIALGEAMGKVAGEAQEKTRAILAAATAELQRQAEAAKQFGAQLASTVISGIQSGNLGSSLGDMLGGQLGSKLGGVLAKTIGSTFGQTLGGMLGPLGAIGGQLLGGLVDKLFSTAGRDAVKAYGEQFGGLNELHRKMLTELGSEIAEPLWIQLTQRVARGNVAQAQSAIDAIERAFEAHKAKAAETAHVIAQKNTAIIDSAVGNVNRLTSQYNALWDTIKNEAPEAVMGIVEQNTRTQMAHIAEEREREMQRTRDMVEDLGMSWDDVLKKLDEYIDRLGDIPAIAIPGAAAAPYEAPEFDRGTPNADYMDFGRGTPAVLHNREAVIGPANVGSLAGQIAAAMGGGGGGGDTYVYIGNEQLDRRSMKVVRKAAATGRLISLAQPARAF